jgi:hypothetical protein
VPLVQVQSEFRACKEKREIQESKVSLVFRDQKVIQESRAFLVAQVQSEFRACKEKREIQESRAFLGHREVLPLHHSVRNIFHLVWLRDLRFQSPLKLFASRLKEALEAVAAVREARSGLTVLGVVLEVVEVNLQMNLI